MRLPWGKVYTGCISCYGNGWDSWKGEHNADTHPGSLPWLSGYNQGASPRAAPAQVRADHGFAV